MRASKFYHEAFYSCYQDASVSSARVIIEELLKHIDRPHSVVDVGCGIGTWLKVWQEKGVVVQGVDGDYVSRLQLLIGAENFMPMDLSAPVPLGRQFDLAESLEVAEHLHETCANAFVAFLCSLSPLVLFGAAIPYQGGDHHVNEQWPEYWAKKFSENGYACADIIRDAVWNKPGAAYYYAQNTFLYVRRDQLEKFPQLTESIGRTDIESLARVHPGNG